MNKGFVGIAFAMLLLAGCGEREPIGEFKEVKVSSKRTEEQCGRGCWNDYYITFEKNGTIVELEAEYENQYNLFKEGNIVTVSYDREYYIVDIKFLKLEGGK